ERKSNRILACRALFGASGSVQLVEELPGPVEEGAELIRIGHKIDNERHRGQHEDCISHGDLPCTDMLILHAPFRNQQVMNVKIFGRKFRRVRQAVGRQRYLDVVPSREPVLAVQTRSESARYNEWHGIIDGGSLA